MLNFTLRQLEYFRAVAQEGSISAAAEKERISRSALASAIGDLESILGCRLFTRYKAKGVVLTPAGVQLLKMSAEVIDSAGRLESRLRGEDYSGELAIGCFASLGPTVIPRLLDYFRDNFPSITLRLRTAAHDELVQLLQSGEIELAIGYGMNHEPSLLSARLYDERIHAVLPKDHPLADRESVNAAQLAQEPLILLDTLPSTENVRNWFVSQRVSPPVRYRFTDFEVVRSLVARGLGYSILIQPPSLDRSYEGRGLVVRPLVPAPAPVPVSCAWLAGRTLTPVARQGVAALRAIAGPSTPPEDREDEEETALAESVGRR